MKKIVLKFGGTSLMDTRRIQNAAEIVERVAAEGYEIVVVVSAMGHTTDHLLSLARDIEKTPNGRELDALLSTGELISASLMTVALQARGFSAKSFTGAEAGIVTNSKFGAAEISRLDTSKLFKCLHLSTIPVVAGFQGVDKDNNVTTLGRGGSDATAILLAGAIEAERCDIYTDVDGVYSVDPRLSSHAYKLDAISFEDMLAMAKCGAKVLQARSVESAMRNHVQVRVRSTFAPNDPGTLVTEKASQVNQFTGLAIDKSRCCLKVELNHLGTCERSTQRTYRHDRHTLKNKVELALIEAGIDFEFGRSIRDAAYELGICIAEDELERALEVVRQNILVGTEELSVKCERIIVQKNLAKLSIIGAQLSSSYEVSIMQSLTKAAISIALIHSQDRQLSVMIPTESIEKAIDLTHQNYCPLKLAS
ncbi:MAG: aspartate kinase [Cyanobacteria bacterium SZAS-4]|nr:aspartate kinase [Cyanobacteria bacterium SZAS-4]